MAGNFKHPAMPDLYVSVKKKHLPVLGKRPELIINNKLKFITLFPDINHPGFNLAAIGFGFSLLIFYVP